MFEFIIASSDSISYTSLIKHILKHYGGAIVELTELYNDVQMDNWITKINTMVPKLILSLSRWIYGFYVGSIMFLVTLILYSDIW